MGSNLKQEAMERVGEVEHHECYYDTDRNMPLPGAGSKCATHATIIATQAGEIAALTAEVAHLAEKLAERDVEVGSSSATHEAWKRPIYYTDVINARQVCRDDLWAVTTDELRALDSFAAQEKANMVGTDCNHRGCNACSWEGETDRMCGGVGPLCPECGETTEVLDAPAAPQPVDAAQATSMDSCNLLDYSAHIAQRKAAGLQPMGLAEFASVVTKNARTAAQAVPELVTQLREYAENPGYSHGDYADAMRQAADALDTTKGA